MSDENKKIIALPVLALRGVVAFPGMSLNFDVGRNKSIVALKAALAGDKKIYLSAQLDPSIADPDFTDLSKVGVIAEVKQIIRVPNSNNYHIIVEGIERACITEPIRKKPMLRAYVQPLDEYPLNDVFRCDGLLRTIKSLFEEYAGVQQQLSPDVVIHILEEKNLRLLIDYIASNFAFELSDRISLLCELDVEKRAELLCFILVNETKLLSLQLDIEEKVQNKIDKNQREYYLREQMKTVQEELGEDDSPSGEALRFKTEIEKLPIDEKSKKKLLEECDRYSRTSLGSPEAVVSRSYIERVINLPWDVMTEDTLDIAAARKIINRDHYGLDEVKERILELVAVRKFSPEYNAQILCLVGPPGVGKTSIVKSLAEALGRKYVRIALGGIHDEAEIRGHRRTYIGSMPGKIITAIEQAGTQNPLILLDEIDKLGSDYKGDPSSALLEALDSEQNDTFCDHYIDIPFDLSKVLFITTANDASQIPAPLYDRMEVIELYSYTSEDKFLIAKKHLVPRQLKKFGMTSKQVRFSDAALRELISSYTKEAGVRALERVIIKILRKCAVKLVEGECDKISVDLKSLNEFLGTPKYKNSELFLNDMVGVANGLAWTAVGGDMLQIEVSVLEGTGKIELTGSLGDVMKESAKAAISYVRSRADKLGIDADFYKTKDIHIHVPEGAVPKDGPSAGVTMTTALVSALSGVGVKKDVAMTGEISLHGNVMTIGGLREKSTAAFKNGMKTVLIPVGNKPDLEKLNDSVKSHLEFIPVTTVDEVLDAALVRRSGVKRASAVKNADHKQNKLNDNIRSSVYCVGENV